MVASTVGMLLGLPAYTEAMTMAPRPRMEDWFPLKRLAAVIYELEGNGKIFLFQERNDSLELITALG